MMWRGRKVLMMAAALAMPAVATAQPLGTFRWQLSPFCNVVTLAVTQNGSIYRLEGFDDQCGATQRGTVTGMAVPNTDGTLEFGLTFVGATAATPSHLDATFNIPSLGGPWRDSAGNSGTLIFSPGSISGALRPAGLGGAAIDPKQVQLRITGTCPAGQFMRSVAQNGAVACESETAGAGDITDIIAGTGLTGGGASGAIPLAVSFGGTGVAASVARSDHTHAVGATSVAVGDGALPPAAGQQQNTALGVNALHATTGSGNVGVGYAALELQTAGFNNTAVGVESLGKLTTGEDNTAVGAFSLGEVTTGNQSTAVGSRALASMSTGTGNVAVGFQTLHLVTAGSSNTGLGHSALSSNIEGSGNVAIGTSALLAAVSGVNTAVGDNALAELTTGAANIAIGRSAGHTLQTGGSNILLGTGAEPASPAENSTIRIGAAANNRAFISGIAAVNVSNATPVVINTSTGQLGTNVSSERFKQDIAPIDRETRLLRALRPVSFVYKPDADSGARELQYGLIAEEVAETMPELVVRDDEGRPLTVRYHLLPPLLLAEIQRLEREREALRRTYDAAIDALREEIASLRAAAGRPR